jgi:hypothetical protein
MFSGACAGWRTLDEIALPFSNLESIRMQMQSQIFG